MIEHMAAQLNKTPRQLFSAAFTFRYHEPRPEESERAFHRYISTGEVPPIVEGYCIAQLISNLGV